MPQLATGEQWFTSRPKFFINSESHNAGSGSHPAPSTPGQEISDSAQHKIDNKYRRRAPTQRKNKINGQLERGQITEEEVYLRLGRSKILGDSSFWVCWTWMYPLLCYLLSRGYSRVRNASFSYLHKDFFGVSMSLKPSVSSNCLPLAAIRHSPHEQNRPCK